MADGEANKTGQKLVEDWQSAVEAMRMAELNATSRRNEERSARRAFANWLLPKDVQVGETIGVWTRDRHGTEFLATVTKQPPGIDADIKLMRRG